jgi:hypothetical protein
VRDPISIRSITFRPAGPIDSFAGLFGWVTAVINGLRVAGLGVRRTRSGRYVVTFPVRRDRAGREHTIVQPIRTAVQREIERTIIAELRRRGDLP